MEQEEESIQLVDHTPEEYENIQAMSKYWRSKSLPVVYVPPLGASGSGSSGGASGVNQPFRQRDDENYFSSVRNPLHHHHIHHPGHHVGKPPLAEIRENSDESDGTRGTRNSSIRSDNTNNTLLLNEKIGPERMREGSNSIGQDLRDSKKRSEWRTLQQHYYPEGDWGWIVTICAITCHAITTGLQLYLSNIVYARFNEGGYGYIILITSTLCHALLSGLQLSAGVFIQGLISRFGGDRKPEDVQQLRLNSCWLGAVSLGVSLLFSPVWVSICKKKSTRLSAVFGGLVASLGCLFTSFASQFHQTFISYGAFLGVGVGLTRDASSLMVGQYFKRKREFVEIAVVSGSGLGIILMSVSVHTAIGSLGWRLGLQAVTVSLILTFFLGTCYRSASLYHPQRRAILHLKNQKRKVKEKGKREDKPPFIDCSCLKSKTLRIILMSSACTAFGIYTPLLSLAVQCSNEGFEDCSILLLHIYIGASWVIGCCCIGLVVVQKSQDCRVSKQYLCQVASVICGISILALTAVKGTSGMKVFSWVYGASLGGYCYSLKVYTYERARARHFPRAWSFLQSSQAIPLFFGVPLTNYANEEVGWKSGYYMSALAVFVGTACLFLTDVRRRKLSRRKSQNSSMKTCETTDGGTSSSPKSKRLSFAFPAEQQLAQQQSRHDSDDEDEPGGPIDIDHSVMIKELTCISEEGLADVDFQDIYFDEWAEYIGECITSCNKVENCLMSEYDPDLAMIVERRARRWSAAKQQNHPQHQLICNAGTHVKNPARAATTGRLTLPGIGTVLEVPLLVAKRLHPNLGVRSHLPHNYSQSHHSANQPQPKGNPQCGSSECTYARGGNCASAGSSSGSSSSQSPSTRVYHHSRAGNHQLSHFPAIDEDSV